MIVRVHGRRAFPAPCRFVTQLPAQHGTRGFQYGTARVIQMKRRANSPYHKMLELVTAHFEVNTKVVHNGDVISEGLRRR